MSKNNNHYFAEILESNLTTWNAQSWQWDNVPKFGSFVTVTSHNQKMFGIIFDITTGPTDPIRQPIPYQKTEEELQQEQPQIFEFLKTSFQCLAIGYEENNKIFYQLPAQPPKIHTFISHASQEEQESILESSNFLYMLFNAAIPQINQTELLLAILKQQQEASLLTKKRLDTFIETFFMLNKNNYQETKLFLHRVSQLIHIPA